MAAVRLGLATLALGALVTGCAKEPMSTDVNIPDQYNGATGQARIEAIRADKKLSSMERGQKIADAQKAAGLPVTGE